MMWRMAMTSKSIEKEWRNEPNEFEFEYKGYNCLIKRGSIGALNGYVFIPKDHPSYGMDYNDLDESFDVHGGLTFSGELNNKKDGTVHFALGFDCAHFNDITPHLSDSEYFYPDAPFEIINSNILQRLLTSVLEFSGAQHGVQKTYKNMAFVKKECENLVDQLITYKG